MASLAAKCYGLAGQFLEGDDGKKTCYVMEVFSNSIYDRYRAQAFCKDKDGRLPEIRGPKDQANVMKMVKMVR